MELAKVKSVYGGVYPPEAGVISAEKLLDGIKKEIRMDFVETKVDVL